MELIRKGNEQTLASWRDAGQLYQESSFGAADAVSCYEVDSWTVLGLGQIDIAIEFEDSV